MVAPERADRAIPSSHLPRIVVFQQSHRKLRANRPVATGHRVVGCGVVSLKIKIKSDLGELGLDPSGIGAVRLVHHPCGSK